MKLTNLARFLKKSGFTIKTTPGSPDLFSYGYPPKGALPEVEITLKVRLATIDMHGGDDDYANWGPPHAVSPVPTPVLVVHTVDGQEIRLKDWMYGFPGAPSV